MTVVKQEFRVNDVVRYIPMGDKEYVLEGNASDLFPLSIKHVNCFTLDGMINLAHTHPLLILIRRPEAKRSGIRLFINVMAIRCPKSHDAYITVKKTFTLVEY